MLTITNEDNMALMARYPDKYFDLAIVDPPYGGGQHFNFRFGTGDKVYENHRPSKEYFKELMRVSKNQIVWGANYFCHDLPENRCWISWFKHNPAPNFSDFELAWTSFDKVSKSIDLTSYGFMHPDKKTIHPTQKPVDLYKKLLEKYVRCVGCSDSRELPGLSIDCDVQTCKKCKGNAPKILDTHLGSGSIAIACHDYGYDLTACELDPEYYAAAMKRIDAHIVQKRIEF